ncbi:OPT family oligopeptide transporter [Haliangium ochraceum]|uniref:Oligopeptide transporter, OPT superfamily n=1 Tax=Haliangium ochraceum (strain DSM 14365 / JCM 11303 / SMP-2) TaxID=502025 RepID=D0LVD2_HALO1|nr:OPT family oligopeptide transporter [Haliangium ochraceum]ACY17493.1 oligopeptide transporter, OPT superfamily [Haliangium ochraceum DSM 14365]
MTSPPPSEPAPHPGAEERIYTPAADEAQLTLRALVVGCLVGALSGLVNLYLGLKTSLTVGTSLLTAILSMALLPLLGRRKPSTLEVNIGQTAGSAGGASASAAGLLAPIPALLLLGYDLSLSAALLWALAISVLGVAFAVPLRNQYLVVERLAFPSGTATAHTIRSLFADTKTSRHARVLTIAAAAAGTFGLLSYFVPALEAPPYYALWAGPAIDIEIGALVLQGGLFLVLASWTFGVALVPALVGVGMLIPTHISLSLLGGSLLAWGLLGPLATAAGWVDGAPSDMLTGVVSFTMWPGTAVMIGDALVSLLLSYKLIWRSLRISRSGRDADDADAVPRAWWLAALGAGTVGACVLAQALFGIPVWMTVLAVALSAVLAAVSTRSAGETDINPVGIIGQVTQVSVGSMAPGAAATNLMTGAITVAGADAAADLMQDLKTGQMLGASPRKQFAAQICGIIAGVLVVVPAFFLFRENYDIGASTAMPAPVAQLWTAVSKVITSGADSLPQPAFVAAVIGGLLGAALAVGRALWPHRKHWFPSGLAVGISFLLPALFAVGICLGAAVVALWRRWRPAQAEALFMIVSCGLLAGDGIMGVIKALMQVLGVPPLVG